MEKNKIFCSPVFIEHLRILPELKSTGKNSSPCHFIDEEGILLYVKIDAKSRDEEILSKAITNFLSFTGNLFLKTGLKPVKIGALDAYYLFPNNTDALNSIMLSRGFLKILEGEGYKKGAVKAFKGLDRFEYRFGIGTGSIELSIVKLGESYLGFSWGGGFLSAALSLQGIPSSAVGFPREWRSREEIKQLAVMQNGNSAYSLAKDYELPKIKPSAVTSLPRDIKLLLKEFEHPLFASLPSPSYPSLNGRGKTKGHGEGSAKGNLLYILLKGSFPQNASSAFKKSSFHKVFKELDYVVSKIDKENPYYININPYNNTYLIELFLYLEKPKEEVLSNLDLDKIGLSSFCISKGFEVYQIILGSYVFPITFGIEAGDIEQVFLAKESKPLQMLEETDKDLESLKAEGKKGITLSNGHVYEIISFLNQKTEIVKEKETLEIIKEPVEIIEPKAKKPKIIITHLKPRLKIKEIKHEVKRDEKQDYIYSFIGREHEKKQIQSALDERFVIINLTGEGGIGKTALFREIARERKGYIFYGSGQSRHGTLPFFASLFNHLLSIKFPIDYATLKDKFFNYLNLIWGKTGTEIDRWREIFPLFAESIWGVKSESSFNDWPSNALHRFIEEHLIEFLQSHSKSGERIILCIDDAQRLNPSDRHRLKRLVHGWANLPNPPSLAIFLISRSSYQLEERNMKEWKSVHIDLKPLSHDDAKKLIEEIKKSTPISEEDGNRLKAIASPLALRLAEYGIIPEGKDKISSSLITYFNTLSDDVKRSVLILAWAGSEWSLEHIKGLFDLKLDGDKALSLFFTDLNDDGKWDYNCLFIREILYNEIDKKERMKWHSIWFKSLPEQGSWIAHLSLLFYHAYEAGMVQEATEIGISLANLYLKEEQYGELTKLLRKLEQLPKKNKIFQFHLSIFDLHLAMKTNQIQEIKRKFHHIDRLASSIKDKREIIDFWLLKARYSLKFESRSLAQDMILEAQHRVKRWKDEEAQGSLSYLKGCIYYQLGQYKHADKHLEEAFNYYLIHEEPLHFYRIAHDFYQLNMDEHDFKKAIKIAEVVIDYSNTKGYAYSKAAWQIKLAAGFYRIEEYKPAEDMLEKAKRYFKVFYVMHKWTTIQSLYSDLLIATGDLDKARLTLENAIDSLRFYEDPKLYLRLNIKYAEVLLKLGQVQRLHQTVDCILKHARSINEYCYFVEGYLILANLYITLGLYSRAKEFVLQASEASKQGTGRHIIALERQYLGLIYNFLGDTEKGYKELKRGLATAETVDDQSLYFTSLYSLARFYISTNAWEEARGIIDKLSNIPSQKSDTSHLSHMDAEIEYLKIFFYFSRYVANRDPKDIEASVSILRRLSSGYSSLGKTSVFDMKLNLLGFHTYESRGDTDMALNYLNNAYKQANAILDENKNDRLQSVLREPQSFIGRVLTLYRKYNQPEEVKQPKPYPKREDKKRQDEKAGFGGKKKGFKDDRRNKQVEEKRIDKHPPQTQKKAIEVKKQERELELPKPQQVEQKPLEAVKPIPQPIEPISKEQTQGFIPRVIKKKIKR